MAKKRPAPKPPSRRGTSHSRSARPATSPGRRPASATSTFRPIVVVGASAGGLEAFSQVLEHLPDRTEFDLPIVFIQHLSPQHASMLPDLVASKTSLAVLTAAEGQRLEPGHVYVAPPNVQVAVDDGTLRLRPRPSDRTQFTPIDLFMRSIARWGQDRVIAVILSGTGSDGAAGIREVKAAGGITIAQTPETAKHDGMPRAAMSTGSVDLVLPPAGIAEHLSHVREHPYLKPPASDPAPAWLDENHQRDLFLALRRASGIDFKQYKPPTVRRRLLRRMALLRMTDLTQYLAYLAGNPVEAKSLSQDLLIHVTRFFRDPESFEVLASRVFGEGLSDRGDDAIRIWVPGCATGEEAYSVGICLVEALGDRVSEARIQIFATDVSEASIEHARTGSYPVGIAADVSPERLKRSSRSRTAVTASPRCSATCAFSRSTT